VSIGLLILVVDNKHDVEVLFSSVLSGVTFVADGSLWNLPNRPPLRLRAWMPVFRKDHAPPKI
jgi:hypothetical protein